MMELGSPVTWTKLCNLFYVFFKLLVLILVCIYSVIDINDFSLNEWMHGSATMYYELCETACM